MNVYQIKKKKKEFQSESRLKDNQLFYKKENHKFLRKKN